MNLKLVAFLLIILCAGLAGGLFYRHNLAEKEKADHLRTIGLLSNEVVHVKRDLEEQKAVNLTLERDLVSQAEELKVYSNNLATVSSDLSKVQRDAKAAAEAAKAEMLKRDAQIAELEAERDDLTKRASELKSSITDLETAIAETEEKLKISEGDREFLLKELKRLQAEKAELERQFNDMVVLREQVRRLRDELSVARRLEWIRRGLYGASLLKGGERLQRGLASAVPRTTTNYNLNVELNRDGTVRVLPPSTNAPSPTNTSPSP